MCIRDRTAAGRARLGAVASAAVPLDECHELGTVCAGLQFTLDIDSGHLRWWCGSIAVVEIEVDGGTRPVRLLLLPPSRTLRVAGAQDTFEVPREAFGAHARLLAAYFEAQGLRCAAMGGVRLSALSHALTDEPVRTQVLRIAGCHTAPRSALRVRWACWLDIDL